MDADWESTNGAENDAAERRRLATNAQQRKWRAENPERVAEYQRGYRERARARDPEEWRRKHREQERRANRRRRQRRDHNAYNRAKYAEDLETSREKSRLYRRRAIEREKAADPEGFRVRHNAAQREWHMKNRDRLNARLREKYRQDPEAMRAKARDYFEKNKERVREKRREYYRNNREAVLAANRRYQDRERRRRAAGLPPRRIHRITAAERSDNQAAADEFFTRPRTPEQKAALERTSPELIARWQQETARQRAIHGYPEDEPLRERLSREREARQLLLRQQRLAKAAGAAATKAAEDARMDAVARAINERLRTQPRSRPHNPAAHPQPSQASPHPQSRGL